MVKDNKTYKQKLGDAVVRVSAGIGWVVGVVFCTALVLFCTLGKKAFEQAEKLATKGQEKMAGKATENFAQAGSDVKEAYNLYQQKEVETTKEEGVEIDEGYHSDSESVKTTKIKGN